MPGPVDGRQLAAQGAGRSRFLPDLGAQGKPMPIPPPVEQMNQRFPISTRTITEKAGPDEGIPGISQGAVQAIERAALKSVFLREPPRGQRVNTRA
ncbi:MAG: hypothetical protein AABZ64_13145 [Nitrospinota bacterium]